MTAEQAMWNTASLRSLCLETSTIDPTKTSDKVFEYVDVSAVSNELWKVVSSTRHTGATAPSRARKLVQAEDVIFATVRPTLKRVALVPQDLDGQVVSTAFCVLRADRLKADPRFIYYSLLTEDFINQVSNLERGASYPAVTDSDVLGQEIVVPPLTEQRAIAAVLSKIQAAVEVQEKIVATLKELKAATMAKLFREGVIKGLMFDSNVFDDLIDGKLDLNLLPLNVTIYVTHVQRDELSRCPNEERKIRLQQALIDASSGNVPTSSFVLGTSRLGEARLGDGSLFHEIRGSSQRKTKDALIAETAIKEGLVLVTNDKDLKDRVQKAGGEIIGTEDLLAGRLRPMKQTEIGEIPESWEVMPLGNLTTQKITDGTHVTPKYVDDGIPFVTATNLTNGSINFATCKKISLEEHLNLSKRCKPEKGDILLSKVGTLGLVAKVETDVPFSIFVQVALVKVDHSKVNSSYLKHVLASEMLQQRIHNRASRSTMLYIGVGKVAEIEIPLPSKNEQEEIVAVLDSLDLRIKSALQHLVILKSLFSSMLHLLMTGQVRVNNQTKVLG